jgi:hypothetical protein
MSTKLGVIALAMLVLAGAMTLKTAAAGNSGSVVMANGGAPTPPSPFRNGGAPTPPSPFRNGGAPTPPSPFSK